ncbi:MAG: hypothetical protein JWN04_3875 [Myxococcaceae bacterium]|nr:hypothetical protein [Myxococcaceae bacterium]
MLASACDGGSSASPAASPDGASDASETDGSTLPRQDAGDHPTTVADGGARGSDAGTDSGAPLMDAGGATDAGLPDAASSSDAGAPSDAGTSACTGTETACSVAGLSGLCVSNVCTQCNSPADNASCTAAYGSMTSSYVCASTGSCVPGNCNVDADCSGSSAGQICGLATANQCGQCTHDAQCQGDPSYGLSTICNTATGACVAAACTTNSTACSSNAADFCCGLACVPGNCCTNADCTSSSDGGICGAGGPNVCGKCTADSQCDSNQVCNKSSGQCVANVGLCMGAPGPLGGAAGTCPSIGNDVCCSAGTCTPAPTGSALACCPGSGGTSYCQGKLGTNATCAGNVCTTCAPISTTAPVYYVDPINGSDNGTGSLTLTSGGSAATCAVKTITRALQLIGSAVVPTQVIVVGGPLTTVGTGEAFPITVPANVTISTQTGPVTVSVPDGKAGFTLNAPNTQITSGAGAPLTITTIVTGTTGGKTGVVVDSGSDTTTAIANVTIRGMLENGIVVNAGVVTIGAGVVSSSNGTNTKTGNGLSVQGGEAIIDVAAGSAATQFNNNTAHGILVGGTGFIRVTGSVTSASTGSGTIETNGNTYAGVWIEQAAGAPQSIISGLVSFANTGGNGMRIAGGSNVKVRGSVFLGNSGSGVIVSSGAGAGPNAIANIDLGTSGASGSNGGNTFQAPLGSGNNANAGLCLAVAANSGTLNAAGNTFHAATCTSGTATLTHNKKGCGNNPVLCAGGVCDLGETVSAGNAFNVLPCSP